jgi:hypothetical protein
MNRNFVTLMVAVLMCGCQKKQEQYEAEAQTTFEIIRLLDLHASDPNQTHPTNLFQLLELHQQGYPHVWHRRFAAFGKHAGFTNSIFEKYVFFPSGITNQWIEGELVLMNKPYPGSDGRLQRNLISKTGNRYAYQVHREESVQALFKEAGIVEPKSIAMPQPPFAPEEERQAFSIRTSRFFVWMAESLGMDSSRWLLLRNISFGAVLVGGISLAVWCWRLRRRP